MSITKSSPVVNLFLAKRLHLTRARSGRLAAAQLAAGVALAGTLMSAASAQASSGLSVASAPAAVAHGASSAVAGKSAGTAAANAAGKAAEKAAEKAAAPVAKTDSDPFVAGTWHGVTPSWPGTLNFDGKAHTAVLAPLGVQPITAKYTYTSKSIAFSDGKSRDGELHMVNTAGEKSDSTYHLSEDGKQLTLTFKDGAEHYVRMTPAEEAAETAKLQQMLAQGKLKTLTPSDILKEPNKK